MSAKLPFTLLGIGGTNGSGKDSLGELLATKHGFMFISMTDMLREELGNRNLPTSRDNMRMLSADWRRKSGLGVLVDKSLEHYKSVGKEYSGLAVASLRNPGEADRVHELGGKVVWIDADPKVRYKRITSRGRHDDNKTFHEFIAEERAEMNHSGDETTLNMSGVKEKADYFLTNNSSNLDDLKAEFYKTLAS